MEKTKLRWYLALAITLATVFFVGCFLTVIGDLSAIRDDIESAKTETIGAKSHLESAGRKIDDLLRDAASASDHQ